MTRLTVLGAVTFLLAACSLGTSSRPAEEAPAAPVIERPEVDPGSMDELIAYAGRHPEVFGGMYIDPPGGDTVVMLFTDDLELHAEAVSAIRPGTLVRRVEHTKAELEALMESLDLEGLMSDEVQPMSAGIDERENRVHLELKSSDPTVELSLELAHGGMLEVTVYPIPGPWENVESGEGWRLLAAGQAPGNEAFGVRAATDGESWDALWKAVAIGGDPPSVDLEEEVAVSFGHGIGSSCSEVRLDGVSIDGGVVLSHTSDPLAPRACTSDLVAAVVFIVALERDALPADGFTLRLCAECDFAEELDVSLP